jgi:CheY-like chemotaxis protein
MGSVLLVEHDPDLRYRIGAWLESADIDVYQCPGPLAPTYTCLASTGQACPLVSAADLVLLDLWLASESAQTGTSASELLAFYVATGKPVVIVDHGHDELRSFRDEVAAVLEYPPDPRDLIETVKVLLSGLQVPPPITVGW